MLLKALNRNPDDTIIVRWLENGQYDQGYDLCHIGVEVPDGSQILDQIITGPSTRNEQIVFFENWSAYFGEAA